jgi:L-iditol 2-dehydrogenase
MKALLLTEYKQLEMTEMPEPDVGPHDVLVRVKSCGICGSDIHGYDGSTGRRIPPLVMGHEAAGQIAAVGNEVTRFAPGDRVTFDSMVSCSRCHFCTRGEPNLCDNRRVLGVSCGDYRRHGAFAEFVVVPDHIVFKLPDTLEYHRAAMVEPVSIAVHAVHLAHVRLADVAVVVGTGMIGALVVQTLRAAGCGTIVGVDLADEKLALAKTFGADFTFNPKRDDVPKELAALTDGRGADIAVECVGAGPPIETAIMSVRKGGTVVLVGNITPRIELPLQAVVTREIKLLGSCASSNEYPTCIDLLARGVINVDPLISARAPLQEGADWFKRLYAGEPGLMKVMLQP